ncbi:MAG: regulatory protein RecX [Actinomycetota bacterium]
MTEHDGGREQAMEDALRLLAARSRSQEEIRIALVARGHPEAVANAVVARLAEVGLADDEALAKDLAERLMEERGFSRSHVRAELEGRGIAPALVDAALAASEGAELENAVRLGEARLPALRSLPPEAAFRRLSGFLARRGYGAEVVEEACRRLLGNSLALID